MIDLAQRYKGIVFFNPAECRCLMDLRTVELIEKDLEILDILKKAFDFNLQPMGVYYACIPECCDYNIETNIYEAYGDEEGPKVINKLKEWLNDK